MNNCEVAEKCAFCGTKPEHIVGANKIWSWYQLRCKSPLCVEHGTMQHITQNRAIRLWNLRQRQHKNILRNAAIAETFKLEQP